MARLAQGRVRVAAATRLGSIPWHNCNRRIKKFGFCFHLFLPLIILVRNFGAKFGKKMKILPADLASRVS
jgi:hypothetical protein